MNWWVYKSMPEKWISSSFASRLLCEPGISAESCHHFVRSINAARIIPRMFDNIRGGHMEIEQINKLGEVVNLCIKNVSTYPVHSLTAVAELTWQDFSFSFVTAQT